MDREGCAHRRRAGEEEDPVDRPLPPLRRVLVAESKEGQSRPARTRGGDERPASRAAGSSFPGARPPSGPGDTPRAHRPVRAARPVPPRRSRAVNGHPCLCNVPVRPARQLSETPARPPSPVLCPAAQPSLTRLLGLRPAPADVGLGAAPLFPGQPHRPLSAAGSCAPEAAGVRSNSRWSAHVPSSSAGGRCCVPAEGPRGATAGAGVGRGPGAEGPGLTPGPPSAAPSRRRRLAPLQPPRRAPPHCLCGPSPPAPEAQPFSPLHAGLTSLRRKSSLPCSEQTASRLGTSAACRFLYRPGSAWADRGPRTVPAFPSVPRGRVRPAKPAGLHGLSVCTAHSSPPAGVTGRTPLLRGGSQLGAQPPSPPPTGVSAGASLSTWGETAGRPQAALLRQGTGRHRRRPSLLSAFRPPRRSVFS